MPAVCGRVRKGMVIDMSITGIFMAVAAVGGVGLFVGLFLGVAAIGFKVEVTDGTLTIGISGSMSSTSNWAHIDEFRAGYIGELEEPEEEEKGNVISGKVYGPNGKKVAGATVQLRGSSSITDTTRLTVTTDANGQYSFDNIMDDTIGAIV